MYHLRLKGTHYEVGIKRGNIFKRCHIIFPLKMDKFQLKHGIESEKIMKKYFPEVLEEIRGITDTINVNYIDFVSWLLAMGCCMYNLEDNHPIEIKGCTAFCVKKSAKVYYGRTNDLPPYLEKGSKSEIYTLENHRFNITTSSFINGEEGINDRGLVVAMTFVLTKLDDIVPGFNSVFVVRYLLEKAGNVEEALKLLMGIPLSSNMNILLADKYGKMKVVECTPNIKIVREPIKINDLEVICTVNNFTSSEMKKYECCDKENYSAQERYETVIKAFQNYKNEDIIEYIKNILKGNYGFMCQYEEFLNFKTVWSSIFDVGALKIYRAEGHPCKKKFIVDNRLEKVKK